MRIEMISAFVFGYSLGDMIFHGINFIYAQVMFYCLLAISLGYVGDDSQW